MVFDDLMLLRTVPFLGYVVCLDTFHLSHWSLTWMSSTGTHRKCSSIVFIRYIYYLCITASVVDERLIAVCLCLLFFLSETRRIWSCIFSEILQYILYSLTLLDQILWCHCCAATSHEHHGLSYCCNVSPMIFFNVISAADAPSLYIFTCKIICINKQNVN